MSEIISKELLSEVLGFEKVSNIWMKDKNLLIFRDVTYSDCKPTQIWNIHELVHKCKVWAYSLNYEIRESFDRVEIFKRSDLLYFCDCLINENKGNDFIPYDPSYIFQACQWILDNKEIK